MRRREGGAERMRVEDVPDWVIRVPQAAGWESDPRRVLFPDLPAPRNPNWYREFHEAQQQKRAWLTEHAPHLGWRDIDAERRRRWPAVDSVSRSAGAEQ